LMVRLLRKRLQAREVLRVPLVRILLPLGVLLVLREFQLP